MRNKKRIIGIMTAAATLQTSLFAGAGNVLASGTTDVISGMESLLVDPTAEPVVTPQKIVTPEAVAVKMDTEGSTSFTFSEDGITVITGAELGYEVEGTQLTINEAGTYYVSGECSDGVIKIKKKTTGVVLVLNGLNLASETTAPLVMASDTEVQMLVYGENTLADTEMNNDETYEDNKDAENAVIKAKSDSTLTIAGGGKLTIQGNAKNALKSNGSLVIDDVILDIDAVDNGISNEDNIVIDGGFIDVKSGGDGIKSASDAEPKGSITINGGTIVVDSMGDGIQATMEVIINDGIVDVITYGGSDAQYDSDDDAYPSAKGVKASGSYEVENEETGEIEEIDATGSALTVNGGTIYLNCADDAMKSDGNVNLYGGYYYITSGADGVQAEYVTTIGKKDGKDNDLYLYIADSEEGIEGASVYMNAGTTRVFASDDGVNAANSDLTGYSYVLEINGGNHYVSCSEGDGFDSNGSLTFTGGTTTVLASSGAGEGDPLDSETGLDITGGTVLGIGRYSPMAGIPKTKSYVQFGAVGGMNNNMGGNMNHPDGDMNGERPQMPGVSSDAVGMPDGDMGGERPQMPGVSADAVGMPGGDMGGERPQMPDGNQGENTPQMPDGTTSNISIKDGDTVIVADKDGKAVAAAIAKWLSDASSYSAGYVFCWSEDVAQEEEYKLYVNGEAVASTEDEPVGMNKNGDVNFDGTVNLFDVQIVLKAAMHISNLENEQAGDMNNDNKITLEDAQMLLKNVLKINIIR